MLAAAGQVGAVPAPRIWTGRGDMGVDIAGDLPISRTIRDANTPFLSDFPWQMLFWCFILNMHINKIYISYNNVDLVSFLLRLTMKALQVCWYCRAVARQSDSCFCQDLQPQ